MILIIVMIANCFTGCAETITGIILGLFVGGLIVGGVIGIINVTYGGIKLKKEDQEKLTRIYMKTARLTQR